MFYKVIAEDNYGTGSGFLFPSSIKPQTLNPFSYSQVVSGVSGIVVASQDSFNGARAQALLKWNRENTPTYVDYEVKIATSGEVLNKIDTVFTKTPFVDGVVRFIQGTGTGRIDKKFFNNNPTLLDPYYSGVNATPIFAPYTEIQPGDDPSTGKGIKWLEHTVLVDTYKALPPGYYTGQPSLSEVMIGSGFTEGNSAYIGFGYNVDSAEFTFFPSGGKLQDGFYTGTYSSGFLGGSADAVQGSAGEAGYDPYYGQLITGCTGSLVA